MAVYRNISINFWTDSKVDDSFSPEDKYIYLYLLTNSHTNICGCYEIGKKQLERETGYTLDTIMNVLYRMEHVHKVAIYDPDTKEIFIKNWCRYNWSKSSKVQKSVAGVIKHIKSDNLRKMVIDVYNKHYGEQYTDNSKQYTDISNQNTESDTVSVTDVSIGYGYSMDTVSERANTPTLEDVKAYCAERNSIIEPVKFYDHYAGRGWKSGEGVQIADWKAMLRSWESNEREKAKHPKATVKPNAFHNFNQRTYDYDALEKAFLGKRLRGEADAE